MRRQRNKKSVLWLLVLVALSTVAIAAPKIAPGRTTGPNRDFLPNGGRSTEVPEPTSIACLLVGTFALCKKRKH